MTDDTAPATRITSADLLAELRGEQQSFRFLMTMLTAILGLAAVIVAGSVLYFYTQLQGLKTSYAEQTRLTEVNLRIVAGEAGRQRESTQAALVAIREENDAARRQAGLARELQLANTERKVATYKDTALNIAHEHILGVPMNEVTSQVVAVVLRADGNQGGLLLTPDERTMMIAAQDDWGGQKTGAVRAAFTGLLAKGASLDAQAMGAAGLSMLEYRAANEKSLVWANGCATVVDYVNQAEARGLDSPMLLLWKGQCLRKRGMSLEAYKAFSAAAAVLDSEGMEVTALQAQLAHHGVGTTLVALVASEQLPDGRDSQAALAEALAELKIAAQIRGERGATQVGVAYTEENIGFIYVLDKDWTTALTHTARIDQILPLAWNLTVRNIAAREEAAKLKENGAARSAINEMRAIQDDTRMVLSLMDCNQIDEPELKRLLPAKYAAVVDELSAHCQAGAQAT